MKYGVAIILAICAGLFYDCTLRPRKGAHDFLVSKGWGAELPKEEVDEAEESQVEQACGEECQKWYALRLELIDLSSMLDDSRPPRAWHRDVPRNKRKPVRLGSKNLPARRLSPKQAAKAILIATEDFTEPPPFNEMGGREVVEAWNTIAQARARAQFVLAGHRLGRTPLPPMFIKKSKHRRTK
jgi:hypothetical protein